MTSEPDRVDTPTVSEAERELGLACALVGEIVDWRDAGNFASTAGNADDDLLAAVEAVQDAARAWRKTR